MMKLSELIITFFIDKHEAMLLLPDVHLSYSSLNIIKKRLVNHILSPSNVLIKVMIEHDEIEFLVTLNHIHYVKTGILIMSELFSNELVQMCTDKLVITHLSINTILQHHEYDLLPTHRLVDVLDELTSYYMNIELTLSTITRFCSLITHEYINCISVQTRFRLLKVVTRLMRLVNIVPDTVYQTLTRIDNFKLYPKAIIELYSHYME